MSKASDLTGLMSIYGESSTLPDGLHSGDKKEFNDGRVFRLAKNGGTALAIGKLAIQGDPTANHINLTPAAAAVGAKKVTVTLGATLAAENEYAEGWLNDRTTGAMYKIKSHPAAALSTALELTLYDPLVTAIPITDKIDLIHNKYYGLVIAVTDQLDMPVGVPNITVTASYYFWVQTMGPCSILCDETLARGAALTFGSSVAGSVEAVDAAGEPMIGHANQAGVDTYYTVCELCLE